MSDEVKHWFGQLAFRDVIAFVVVVGSVLAFFFARERDASTVNTKLDAVMALQTAFNKSQTDMNDRGTVASRLVDQEQADLIGENTRRIEALESSLYKFNEKITDVQSKLSVIASMLEGRKKNGS